MWSVHHATPSIFVTPEIIMYYKECIKECTCDFLGGEGYCQSYCVMFIENKQHFLSNHN